MKTPFQKIINVISWLFLIAFLATIVVTAASNLNVVGGYKTLIVQSGSMEPTIMTGDVILIAHSLTYQNTDVISFTDEEGQITTHRIVEFDKANNRFITKGDANRVQDEASVESGAILGKVILTIPKFGHFIYFVRSLPGLIIFIGIPAFIICLDEITKIVDALRGKKRTQP